MRFSSAALLLMSSSLLLPTSAFAQGGNPAWFIPGQTAAPKPHPAAHPHTVRSAPSGSPAAAEFGGAAVGASGEAPPAPVQAKLPPMPAIPDVARSAMPPAAVIGVLSIPDVLRASTAYREADKTMAERRKKLNEDAQKEQLALRDLSQSFANDRTKLSADQIHAKERELQDRITESRRKFTERGQVIQDDSQYALAQIERTLTEIVARVAGARGMNLVLQRAEVALNQGEFDITAQVASVLNKALPTVVIPPDGVEPPTIPAPKGGPAIASAAPPGTSAAADPTDAKDQKNAASPPAKPH